MDNQVENMIMKEKIGNKLTEILIFSGICITSIFRFIMKMDFSNAHTTARSLGALCGIVLSGILFIFGISALIYKISKKDKKKIILIVSVIYLIANFGMLSNEYVKIRLAEEKMSSIITSVTSGNKIKKEEITYEKYGEAAEVVNLFQSLYSEMQVIDNEFNNNIYELDTNAILSYEILSDYNKLLEIRVKLNQSIEDIRDYFNSIYKLYETYAEKIKTFDKSNNYSKHVVIRFNEKSEANLKNLKYKEEISSSLYISMDNILKFLEEKNGEYIFEDEELLFLKQEDVDSYNELIDKYNNSVDLATELLNDNEKNVKELMDILNGEEK